MLRPATVLRDGDVPTRDRYEGSAVCRSERRGHYTASLVTSSHYSSASGKKIDLNLFSFLDNNILISR